MLRNLPIGDALEVVTLHELRKHLDTMRVGRNEYPELPGDDFVEQAVGGEPLPHCAGETGELDAVDVHDLDAPQLQSIGEVQDGAAAHQRGEGVLWGKVRPGRTGGCDPGR